MTSYAGLQMICRLTGLAVLSTFMQPAFAQVAAAQRSNGLFVGILNDNLHEVANWQPGPARDRIVLVAFKRTDVGWKAVRENAVLPTEMRWHVAFDGKQIGSITTADSGSFPATFYGVRMQGILMAPKDIPIVGVPSEAFGPMGIGPTKDRRPLVVVSAPNVQDPDGWKRLKTLPDELVAPLKVAFRQEFPKNVRCRQEKIVQRNWQFPDSALCFPVSYGSNKGSYLVQARLDAGDCGYVDDPNDPLSGPWFFVATDGRVKRIGSFMRLLDAGDYDNDGSSEVVFLINQPEDTDGFILFSADFEHKAIVSWSYH